MLLLICNNTTAYSVAQRGFASFIEDSRMTTQHIPSRLERLPAELRNKIYRYAVVEDDIIGDEGFSALKGNARTYIQPSLAFISRQIRSEVLPIFYRENTFGVRYFGLPWDWKKTFEQWLTLLQPFLKYMSSFEVVINWESSRGYIGLNANMGCRDTALLVQYDQSGESSSAQTALQSLYGEGKTAFDWVSGHVGEQWALEPAR
ncbi:hypothetical protein LTR37_004366 [Vermiconidia calcicola]|uniref:Uncharacterized protein n=1 Tax=Vermiconidia calcicola TaxID=1690605 RepID=A0ACC3NMQ5_9PEZI|nr:hypothetical protein LTR37_004366 [Vermiconidia calcicola]